MNQSYNRNSNNRGHRFRGGYSRGGFGRGNRGSWGQQQHFRGSHPRSRDCFRKGNISDSPDQGNWNVSQQWRKSKPDTPGKRLCESDIGVTEYISDHEGFNGIIKSRYSDFHVSEISKEGYEAKLTELKPPTPPIETVDEDEELLLTKYNVEILPLETWDNINKLAVCQDETTETVEIDVTGMTKEQRTKIHEAVKKAFGSSIVGSTVTAEDKKCVRFQKFRKGVRIDTRVKWIWPGEYVYFVVYKENCDTMDAASLIAERLKMNLRASTVGFAGTKDRRAKTSQWMSMRRIEPSNLAQASTQLRSLSLGNFRFCSEPLKLGMLRGNRFQIALRNVTAPEETIEAACKLLVEKGFVNYYGLQRFGTRIDTPTYQIGLKLLLGHYQEAIDQILVARDGPMQESLQLYHKYGARAALRALPTTRPTPEVRLLKSLARDPRDKLSALAQVPRNTRLLYLHSYQSLVWNRAVSERFRRFGRKPVVGDIVLCDAAYRDTDVLDIDKSDDSDDEENDDITDKKPVDKSEDKSEDKTEVQAKLPVKILTQEDIDKGVHTIFDVVMPLPGHNIEYPPNMKDCYEELLKKDGLELTLKNKHRSYSMSGAYRLIVSKPSSASWRVVRYSDPRADLIPSQLDILNGVELDGILPDGKYKALLLDIILPASCYATMALRELMKVNTSVDNQAQQNNYFKTTESEDEGKKSSETKIDDSEVAQVENGVLTVKDEITETVAEQHVDKRKLEDEEHEEHEEAKKIKMEDKDI